MERPKLLLADDSVTIRKVVELTFADEGIDVTAVADADSAMQRFVETQPDIVLVDATLAGTSGYRICEMIKADDATKHIPVLLLVGSFERFDDDEAVRVGADGFMTKPFQSIRELVGKVRDLLEAGSSSGTDVANPNVTPPVPVFGEEFGDSRSIAWDDEQQAVEPLVEEEDDIEHLYRESFVEPEPAIAPESGPAEDLGHVGMDDDMIEAAQPEPTLGFAEVEPLEVPLRENYDPDKKFDWSAEELVSEPGPEQGGEFEPGLTFAEDEPESPADTSSDAVDGQPPASESVWEGPGTTETDRSESIEYPAASPDTAEEDTEILDLDPDLDDTPAPHDFVVHTSHAPAMATAELEPEAAVTAALEAEHDPAIHETVPYDAGEQPPILEREEAAADERFPPEIIDLIAQKVIERLSDTVVREVARIEVPRVAEKLIREALDGRK